MGISNIVLFILLLIGGLFFFIMGLSMVFHVLVSGNDRSKRGWPSIKGWPSVRGTIVTSTGIETETEDLDGWIQNSYEPIIEYKYQVGGKNYIAEDPRIDKYKLNTCELVEEHPVGKQVDVFYHSKNPQDSRLNAYVEEDWDGIQVAGFVALALGAALLCMIFYAVLFSAD